MKLRDLLRPPARRTRPERLDASDPVWGPPPDEYALPHIVATMPGASVPDTAEVRPRLDVEVAHDGIVIWVDGVPRVGLLNELGCDGDPKLVVWADPVNDGEAVLAVSLAGIDFAGDTDHIEHEMRQRAATIHS